MKRSELKRIIREELLSLTINQRRRSRVNLSQDLDFDYKPGQAKKLSRPIMVVDTKTGASHLADFIQSTQIPLELDTNGKYLKKWRPQSFQRLLKGAVSEMYNNTSTDNYIPLTKKLKEQFTKEMVPIVKSLQKKFSSWLTKGWMQHIARSADSGYTKSTYPQVQIVLNTPEYKKMIKIRQYYKAQLKRIVDKRVRDEVFYFDNN